MYDFHIVADGIKDRIPSQTFPSDQRPQEVYVSVPHAAMWHTTEMFGVPDSVVQRPSQVIRTTEYKHMCTLMEICWRSDVQNGLWQGCTLAPNTLQSVYLCIVKRLEHPLVLPN